MNGLPVIRQLDEVLRSETGQFSASILLFAIFFSEIQRARVGWVEPEIEIRTLREGYLPGDLGFDPSALRTARTRSIACVRSHHERCAPV